MHSQQFTCGTYQCRRLFANKNMPRNGTGQIRSLKPNTRLASGPARGRSRRETGPCRLGASRAWLPVTERQARPICEPLLINLTWLTLTWKLLEVDTRISDRYRQRAMLTAKILTSRLAPDARARPETRICHAKPGKPVLASVLLTASNHRLQMFGAHRCG